MATRTSGGFFIQQNRPRAKVYLAVTGFDRHVRNRKTDEIR